MRRSNRTNMLCAAMTALWTTVAVAAEPGPEELYRRGSEAYRASRYDEAIALLGRAQALEPHAELAYDLGRAYEGAGDLRRAVESFREYLRLAPDAKDRAAVESRITNIGQRLGATRPKVTVTSHPDGATVVVDGLPLGTTPWKGALAPGVHRVVLERAGTQRAVRAVVVSQKDIVLDLDLAEVPKRPNPTAPPERDGAMNFLTKVRVPTWIALGVGAAGLGTAAGFELAQQSEESEARAATTQLGHHSHYDSAATDRDVARVLFGVGAAAMVTSAVLFTIDLTRKPKHVGSGSPSRTFGLTVGTLRADLTGQF